MAALTAYATAALAAYATAALAAYAMAALTAYAMQPAHNTSHPDSRLRYLQLCGEKIRKPQGAAPDDYQWV
jgi:hypothetical protein